MAIAMAFELTTYGVLAGWLFGRAKWQCTRSLYRCLILSMIGGRLVWGAAEVILLGLSGSRFSWSAFAAGALLDALPGIVLQLVLIPAVMLALDKTHLVPFRQKRNEDSYAV